MSLTEGYTRVHNALARGARSAGVRPYCARVLVAVFERGGTATRGEIAQDLGTSPEAPTEPGRSLRELIAAGLVVGLAVDGGERRTGVETCVKLTDAGRVLALEIVEASR